MSYRPGATREMIDERSRDTREWIANVLFHLNLDAHEGSVGLTYDWIAEHKRRDFTKVDHVREAAKALELANNDDLWREVFENNPDLDTGASRAAIKDLSNKTQSPIDVSHLRRALEAVIENTPELLLLTPEETERQRRLERRNNQIAEITANYTQGYKLRTPNGGIKVFDRDGVEVQFQSMGGRAPFCRDAGFDGMSDEEVSAVCEQLRTERRMRSMSKEGLKAEINWDRKAKYEASSTSMGPNPLGTVLVNPDTGETISDKRTLIRFINQARDNTKRLITRRGQTDKVLAREFERLLNS